MRELKEMVFGTIGLLIFLWVFASLLDIIPFATESYILAEKYNFFLIVKNLIL